jgi:hypothetical protein
MNSPCFCKFFDRLLHYCRVAYSSIYQLSILIFLLLIVILTPPLYLIKKSIGSLQILSILIDVVRSAPNGIVCAEALMLSLLGP